MGVPFFQFLLLFSALCLPAVAFPSKYFEEDSRWENIQKRIVGTLALAIFLAYVLATFHRLNWFWGVWIFLILVLALFRLRDFKKEPTKEDNLSWSVGLVLVSVGLLYFVQSFLHAVPPGWDPSFHMILAKKTLLENGTFPTWAPFDTVTRNYPLGSHLLLVLLSSFNPARLTHAFGFLISALGILSTLQVYVLGITALRNRQMALYAALAYGLWAVYGSINYHDWGGLPNQLGMLFLLHVLWMASKTGSRKSIFWGSLAFAAVPLVHHHVMLCLYAVTLACLFPWPRFHLPSPDVRKRLFLIFVLGNVLASFYLLPYVVRIFELESTSVWTFRERLFTLGFLASRLGAVFFSALLGTALISVLSRKKIQIHPLVSRSVLVLLGLFVIFGYLYRGFALWKWGESLVAFTPSRFLTNAVYLLAIPIGWGLFHLKEKLNASKHLFLVLLIALSLTNLSEWKEMIKNQSDANLLTTFSWVRKNSPEKTILLNDEPWAPYFSWRVTSKTPIPISEPAPWRTMHRKRLNEIQKGRVPPEYNDYEIWAVRPNDLVPEGVEPLIQKGSWSVIRLYP